VKVKSSSTRRQASQRRPTRASGSGTSKSRSGRARPPGPSAAGYSGTPLPQKLGIKSGVRVLVIGAPSSFPKLLGELPEDVRFVRSPPTADLALLFTRNHQQLAARLGPLVRDLGPAAKFWIAWPKKTSELALDLDENVVRDEGLRAGFVDYKVCAIDADWSGLLFSRRKG
jgi:hypothetical protein